MDCGPPGSFVRGILQARIPEWVAISSSRDLPNPGIKHTSPSSSVSSALACRFFNTEAPRSRLSSPVCVLCVSHSVMSDSLQPHALQPAGLFYSQNSPDKNTEGSSHSFLQRTFPTQGSNLGLPHCRRILYCLSHYFPYSCRLQTALNKITRAAIVNQIIPNLVTQNNDDLFISPDSARQLSCSSDGFIWGYSCSCICLEAKVGWKIQESFTHRSDMAIDQRTSVFYTVFHSPGVWTSQTTHFDEKRYKIMQPCFSTDHSSPSGYSDFHS